MAYLENLFPFRTSFPQRATTFRSYTSMNEPKKSPEQYQKKLSHIIFYHPKALLTLAIITLYGFQKYYFVQEIASRASLGSPLNELVLLYGISLLSDITLFALSDIAASYWETHSLRFYFHRIEKIYIGRCDLLGAKKAQDQFVAATVSPAPELVTGIIDYTVQLVRVAFSSVGLALGLSVAVNREAGVALVLSAILMAILAFTSSSAIRKIASLRNSARARLSSKFTDGFNAIVIGNTDSTRAWKHRALIAKRRYFNRSISQTRTTSVAHACGALVTYGTVLISIMFFTIDPKLTIALFPKLLEGCKAVMDCGNLVSSMGSAIAGFTQLQSFLDEPIQSDIHGRISWEKISAYPAVSSLRTIDDLPKSGRTTLRGPNGSGKSSILLLLKIEGGASTLLLPAGVPIAHDITTSRSSLGEAQRMLLRSAINSGVSTVLLDEWDANLDDSTIASVSQELDRLSQIGIRIIETRHRFS